MEWLCFLFFLALAVPAVVKALTEAAKKRELEQLKQQNPELWVQLKQMEHEQAMIQQQTEQQKKQIQHDRVKTGIGIGFQILQWMTKK